MAPPHHGLQGHKHAPVRRDVSDPTPPSNPTITAFAAVIAILSAVILGYIIYRLVKRHRRLHPNTLPSPTESSLNQKRLQNGGVWGQLSRAGTTYEHFPSLGKLRLGSQKSQGGVVVLPDVPPTPQTRDWRPATLTPYQHGIVFTPSDGEGESSSIATTAPPVPPLPAKLKEALWEKKGARGYSEIPVVSPLPQYPGFHQNGESTPVTSNTDVPTAGPSQYAYNNLVQVVNETPLSPSPTFRTRAESSYTAREDRPRASEDRRRASVRASHVSQASRRESVYAGSGSETPKRISSFIHGTWKGPSPSPGLPPPPVPPVPPLPSFGLSPFANPQSRSPSPLSRADSPIELQERNHGDLDLPRLMLVTAVFTPSLSDELPIGVGELVKLHEEYADGWCFVQKVSRDGEERRECGAVPRFCISEIGPRSSAATRSPSIDSTFQRPKSVKSFKSTRTDNDDYESATPWKTPNMSSETVNRIPGTPKSAKTTRTGATPITASYATIFATSGSSKTPPASAKPLPNVGTPSHSRSNSISRRPKSGSTPKPVIPPLPSSAHTSFFADPDLRAEARRTLELENWGEMEARDADERFHSWVPQRGESPLLFSPALASSTYGPRSTLQTIIPTMPSTPFSPPSPDSVSPYTRPGGVPPLPAMPALYRLAAEQAQSSVTERGPESADSEFSDGTERPPPAPRMSRFDTSEVADVPDVKQRVTTMPSRPKRSKSFKSSSRYTVDVDKEVFEKTASVKRHRSTSSSGDALR